MQSARHSWPQSLPGYGGDGGAPAGRDPCCAVAGLRKPKPVAPPPSHRRWRLDRRLEQPAVCGLRVRLDAEIVREGFDCFLVSLPFRCDGGCHGVWSPCGCLGLSIALVSWLVGGVDRLYEPGD